MSTTFSGQVLEVDRSNWGDTRLVAQSYSDDLQNAEVLIEIDRFALTANNISYASAGDLLGYWSFFPAEDNWGRIPVMGYGNVVASAHPDIAIGERLWGFYPMGSYLLVEAGKVNEHAFSDVSEHRKETAPTYSNFQRAAANPVYDPAREDHDLLLRGLYFTSFLVEDFMFDNDHFGAAQYLITSASSKTSIALAYAVRERGLKKAIGLTSAGNIDFVTALGCYDQVLNYDDIASLDASIGTVLVDMAGNAQVNSAVHHHFANELKYSCRIGATHYDQAGSSEGFPGAKAEFFFAPGQAQKRAAEWGQGEVEKRVGAGLLGFQRFSDAWMQVQRSSGAEAIKAAYQRTLAGQVAPSEGLILSMGNAS